MKMSQNKKSKYQDIGKLRNSQLITTWGPGSIIQLKNDTALVVGLDKWPEAFLDSNNLTKFKVLHHPYLEKICKKTHFRMPQSDEDIRAGIPVVSFPTWGYCSSKYCRRLQQHKQQPLKSDPEGKFYCQKCGNELISARLVLMCKYGHLDDFPWVEWAHSEWGLDPETNQPRQTAHICKENPELIWRSSGGSTSISSYYVKCLDCGRKRWMTGAMNQRLPDLPDKITNNSIPFVCRGKKPWLPDTNHKCPPPNVKGEKDNTIARPKAELTRSTSLYFSSVTTAIQIPKFRHVIHEAIEKNYQSIQNLMLDGDPIEKIAQRQSIFKDIHGEFSTDEIIEKINERFFPTIENELDIRDEEFYDLVNTNFKGDNIIDIQDTELTDEHKKLHLTFVKRVNRLTIIKVLRGFTRSHPPNPYSKDDTKFSKLYTSENIDWLPGVESRGEGIFFSFDEQKIAKWAQNDQIKQRCNAIIESLDEWSKIQNMEPRHITPKYILLHTIAHVLIRKLAFSSGYNEASLSERIYCNDEHNGIFIYTSSSSSEGSLGGLVRQADNFATILNDAINDSTSCGRDPLCLAVDPTSKIEKDKPAYNRLNGSACYYCCQLPETSCEDFNKLLDRKLLARSSYAFFGDQND